MDMPIQLLKTWLFEEKQRGANDPQQAVLSTVTEKGIPHARVVAIREITGKELVFFTQSGTKKVPEMRANPNVNLTFWFDCYQREVIIQGRVEALSSQENEAYWQHYSKEAQVRFYAYAPSSGKSITSKKILEQKRREIRQAFSEKPLPISPYYCGFRVIPAQFVFYQYHADELSDVVEFIWHKNQWEKQLLSP